MKAIIAVNNLGYIGLNGEIPWYSREDFRHFKDLTKDSTLLVGFNTYPSVKAIDGKNGRTLFEDMKILDCYKADWCIGGKKTYEKYCYLFDELHISYINDNTIGDTTFPLFKNLKKDCKIFRYYFDSE